MPTLKIERIISFSSEDKVHIANNLLGNINSLKWKCANPGEKQAVVCFQLQKASVITGIDIGNEHSAYIEVMVSRSGSDEDYVSLLVMSSFMSAVESRQSTNINRVRMFKQSDFLKPQCEEKWDRVKVVCTQPFNRHVKYGLSFIKFLSNEIGDKESSSSEIKLGKFTLKPQDDLELQVGSTFMQRRLEKDKDGPSTAAASLRDANFSLLNGSRSPLIKTPKLLPDSLRNSTPKTKAKEESTDEFIPKPRHRKELFYTDEDEAPNKKIDRMLERREAEKMKKTLEENKNDTAQLKKKKKEETKRDESKIKTPLRDHPSVSKTPKDDSFSKTNRESLKRKQEDVVQNSPKKVKPDKRTKPFEKLLEDVVLVISGIQNPDRATLRGQVLEMGAKYKGDWDSSCTHLVCAFMNTPKFQQVRGKGKIVTRQWVEECFSQRKKLPWRRYALDKQERKKEESEDEIWEKIEEARTDTEPIENGGQNLGYGYNEDIIEQASDTEEIIEKIRNDALRKDVMNMSDPISHCSKRESDVSPPETNNVVDVRNDGYSAETDTDEESSERKQLVKNKPFDFFKHKTFFIDCSFEDYIEEMLKNYVFIHEGSLAEDPTENVDYMICGMEKAKGWSEVNPRAICVLPDWVVDCHKCRQFIPPDEYFVL